MLVTDLIQENNQLKGVPGNMVDRGQHQPNVEFILIQPPKDLNFKTNGLGLSKIVDLELEILDIFYLNEFHLF